MTETDQIAQALMDALTAMATMEELLTDEMDALHRLESTSTPSGTATPSEPSAGDGSTACP